MVWTQTLQNERFKNYSFKTLMLNSSLLSWSGLFYWLVVGGGFLKVVGFKTYASLMTLFPALVPLAIGCYGLGTLWQMVADESPTFYRSPADSDVWWNTRPVRRVLQTTWEGAQLGALFLLTMGTAIIAFQLTLSAPTWIQCLIGLILLLAYPLPLLGMVMCRQHRTLHALLGQIFSPACFTLLCFYPQLWLQITLWLVFTLGLLLPLGVSLLALSLVGVFFLPGLLFLLAMVTVNVTKTAVTETLNSGSTVASQRNSWLNQLLKQRGWTRLDPSTCEPLKGGRLARQNHFKQMAYPSQTQQQTSFSSTAFQNASFWKRRGTDASGFLNGYGQH